MADRTSRDDNRDSARRELETIGFIGKDEVLQPWQNAVLPLLIERDPRDRSGAFLDFIVTSALSEEITKLTEATERLVKSSDNNTDRMEKVGKQLNTITTMATVAAGASALTAILGLATAWQSSKTQPPTLTVSPAITVAPAATPLPTPIPTPTPATKPVPKKGR